MRLPRTDAQPPGVMRPKKVIAKRGYVRHAQQKDKHVQYEKKRVRSAAQKAKRKEQAPVWAHAFVEAHGAKEVRTRNNKAAKDYRARQKAAE